MPAEKDLHASLAPPGLLHEGVPDSFWHLSNGEVLLDVSALPTLLLDLQGQSHVLSQGVGGEPASLQVLASETSHPSDSLQSYGEQCLTTECRT